MPTSARAPGDLIDAADYAFSHAILEPRPDPPRTLLILLHGVGGDEQQLVALGDSAPEDTLVVLPRGPRTISGGRLGWYRVGISDDGLEVVEDEEAEARAKLVDFVGQLQSRFDVAPRRTWIGGFSQGGILAASAALTAPDRVAGFFMVAGRLLPDLAPTEAESVRALQAFVAHGREDDTLPMDDTCEDTSRLRQWGITTTVEVFNAGHAPEPAMLDAAARWLAPRLRGQ